MSENDINYTIKEEITHNDFVMCLLKIQRTEIKEKANVNNMTFDNIFSPLGMYYPINDEWYKE